MTHARQNEVAERRELGCEEKTVGVSITTVLCNVFVPVGKDRILA